MGSELRCRHCGERIVRQDFLGQERYVHQPIGASFMDGQHPYCHLTRAWPEEARDG